MFSSLKLGRLLGIDLFVHGTFWLLPAFVLFNGYLTGQTSGLGLDLAVLFALFGCVALHELGHAVAAAWYGIRTRDITLYPIGGVARLENMPETPLPEIVIALAGPAVNVLIAAALAAVLVVGHTGGYAPSFAGGPALGEFLTRVLIGNVGLVAFNLIPAFPMDGGRVFRAALQLVTDRLTATRVAAAVGAGLAGLLGLYGLYDGSVMLVVLAGFLFLIGQGELAGVRYREGQKERAAARAARERLWAERGAGFDPYAPPPTRPAVTVAAPIDGWVWDDRSGLWVEWRNGYPVRRWSAD